MSSNPVLPNPVLPNPVLPAWPPILSDDAKNYLSHQATDFALAQGIIYRPIPISSSSAPPTDSAIHAPFSLTPSPFPRNLFNRAQAIQSSYDLLYAQISSDHQFLQRVIGESVVQVDEFQKQLWDIYTAVKDDLVQPLSLGLFRSDYLLHDAHSEGFKEAELGSRGGKLELKQVEFNTISASFGALCTKVSGLHRHLASTTDYLNIYNGLENLDNLPVNRAQEVLIGGLAAAHAAYLSQKSLSKEAAKNVYILFVVQEGERNAFDQRPLEHSLQTRGIRVLRQTFAEIASRIVPFSAGPDRQRMLCLSHPVLGKFEISTVYYRAGYGPSDYTSTRDWQTRKTLELSEAIKCPSIAVQLAGAKKVQQVLAEPDELERLLDVLGQSGSSAETELRETFTDLYPLDDSALGQKGYQLALTQPHNYVLKPQREGGGNNVYRNDIPGFLKALETSSTTQAGAVAKRQAYILMSLIKPPSGLGNYLVKANVAKVAQDQGKMGGAVLAKDTVSELGVYGAVLFENNDNRLVKVKHHESGGYLLRTKGRESDEGGVAVGFSVIDSPFLI
ncbi:related to glutathione synthase [Melanopsichium pennsylvanicum]|uniref:Glutathione synthetase n=2 Tax=Melanopsichium pennsylvanicum TaxID=63383 RepID=A0AAJ4XQR6_9BASI|nr:related to glutathione synthase [Melanopsichium pennsylvanicum 4]SNX86677.1 related to glutathione synthase [Melanopsichium pennsylvanicum]